jgi:methyl-accepting chemotaxis protein
MRTIWPRRQAQSGNADSNAQAPAVEKTADTEVAATGSTAVRETIDLLERDLTTMVRDIGDAAEVVCRHSRVSVEALGSIEQQTKALATQSRDAQERAAQLAAATEEMVRASNEIGGRVREASAMADQASEAAAVASRRVDGLKSSSGEIGAVVDLIGTIAKQTNLLALNATIEAARAGVAGRGFAVVASEVKALSAETHKAIDEIRRKIEALQSDAAESVASVHRIDQVIATIRPVFASAAGAVEEQAATSEELSRNAAQTSAFVSSVADSAAGIERATSEAKSHSIDVDTMGQRVAALAAKLQTRSVIFLRQSEIGDRRRHDRLPCQIGVTLGASSNLVRGVTVDLSEGGMLVRTPDDAKLRVGAAVEARIDGIGACRARVVNRSALGLHIEFVDMDASSRGKLEEKLLSIREENNIFVERAVTTAAAISARFEEAVSRETVSREDLFDVDYAPIEGTEPAQFRTRYLDWLERVLPDIQEPLLATDPRMVFCCAVDRNGYLPVHNKAYSKPQKPGEVAWNTANCRNRRIFDDRAGLSAARNVRPYVIQSYPRDMGNGVTVMMREVDAPIRVFGKHWGGFRTAYKL